MTTCAWLSVANAAQSSVQPNIRVAHLFEGLIPQPPRRGRASVTSLRAETWQSCTRNDTHNSTSRACGTRSRESSVTALSFERVNWCDFQDAVASAPPMADPPPSSIHPILVTGVPLLPLGPPQYTRLSMLFQQYFVTKRTRGIAPPRSQAHLCRETSFPRESRRSPMTSASRAGVESRVFAVRRSHRALAVVAALLVLVPPGPVSADSAAPGEETISSGLLSRRLRANFRGSETPAAPNQVRLVKVSRAKDRVTVGVVLGGATTSADIYSWAFDLELVGAAVEYVPGSAVAGDAMVPAPGQAVSAQVSTQGNRLVVGVSKTGGGSGNAVAGVEATIVTLTFRVLAKGKATIAFAGAPDRPGHPSPGPTALDSSGEVVSGITFDPLPGTLIAKRV